jgi:hypothetical protein
MEFSESADLGLMSHHIDGHRVSKGVVFSPTYPSLRTFFSLASRKTEEKGALASGNAMEKIVGIWQPGQSFTVLWISSWSS